MPRVDVFGPVGPSGSAEAVILSVDEYEIIRLMDWEGLSQDESASRMGVARSTVQRIYEDARKKLADFLINGKPLRIEGGDYRLCEANETDRFSCHGCCRRHGCQSGKEPDKSHGGKS